MSATGSSTKDDVWDEEHTWHLMTENFYWSPDALRALRVGVHSYTNVSVGDSVRLQPFEVIVAAVFAKLRPDYDWWVTPNLPDGGVDFVGRGVFLSSDELGIDAAITIGGQCKKRKRVSDVVSELSGSFVRMASTLHPTFFVAALSACLNAQRIAEARETLESTLQRHCHILERRQLESLIADNLGSVEPIIRQAFTSEDAARILQYFEESSGAALTVTTEVAAPSSVLAGQPFRIRLQVSQNWITGTALTLTWRPPRGEQSSPILIAPLEADTNAGLEVEFADPERENPFLLEIDFEFLLYAIGSQPLGAVDVYRSAEDAEPATVVALPPVHVVENLRPPFYDVPYREPIDEIQRAFERACTGKVTCVAIAGAGGAGKTRLCEEMALESRRRGAHIVSARQAHSTDVPRRILANLLLALADSAVPGETPSRRVEELLARLEPNLASQARPALRALCEQAGKPGSFEDDQALLSVLAVLIAQRARTQPIVIHLHDLHWCTTDVLELIDRLIWQLDHLTIQVPTAGTGSRIRALFLLEGRMHEHREDSETGWSTRIFEAFIARLGCPVAHCRAFGPQESFAFAQRLFEQVHSANRKLPESLMSLQAELVEGLCRAAGGNPLHMLEQVKLLQQNGVVAQNPQTGFIYMTRPEFRQVYLPSNVLETIEARWRYYWIHNRKLAILLWAAALVDDNLPAPLFDHLWRQLAPHVTRAQLEGTEFLRFPHGTEDSGLHISFRHENYFRTTRGIQLPDEERQRVVTACAEWFESTDALSPEMRYVQAKVELEASDPDFQHARQLLRTAQRSALKRRDYSLASRVLATLLDAVTWPMHQRKPLPRRKFVQACDDELELCEMLIRAGQSDVAHRRIESVLDGIESRHRPFPSRVTDSVDPIVERRFMFLSMKAQILFHSRQPAEAAAITSSAVEELRAILSDASEQVEKVWRSMVMRVHHTHSAAIAFTGDLDVAVAEARKAAAIAESLLGTERRALDVIITSANILLCRAPEESEQTLERHLAHAEQPTVEAGTKLRLQINLSMARIVLAYQRVGRRAQENERLKAALDSLRDVFKKAHPLGRLKDAAAAALLLGLIYALWGESKEIDWFSQATALSIRSRQLETLWRAYINLAHALHRNGKSPHDPAAAALDLMTESLSAYSDRDRNPRFDLLSVPMAHAVRYLLLAQDRRAQVALRKFPAVRKLFKNLKSAELKSDRDGRSSHEWLRIGSADYVLY